MIETMKPFHTAAGQAGCSLSPAETVPACRPLTWRDLVARFPAWTGAGAMLANRDGKGHFAPMAAGRLALLSHGNHAVNLAGLGKLKAVDGTDSLVTRSGDAAI